MVKVRKDKMKNTIIGICDDELGMCKIIKKMIENILTKLYGDEDEFFEIRVFHSAQSLLEEIDKISIVFLDVEMPNMDGMEAGKYILRKNPDCKIIIETSNDKRYSEGFKINAHRYLNKPLLEEDMEEAIVSAMNKTIGNNIIEVFQNRIKYNITQKEIIYIKAFNGYVEIYTARNVFTRNVSLGQLEEELDSRIFFRIHRQYIVGLKHIVSVDKGIIQLTDGERLTVSRRKLMKFEKAFIEYDLNFGG